MQIDNLVFFQVETFGIEWVYLLLYYSVRIFFKMIFELSISGISNIPPGDLGSSWNRNWKLLSPLGFKSGIFKRGISDCPLFRLISRYGFWFHPCCRIKCCQLGVWCMLSPAALEWKRRQGEVERRVICVCTRFSFCLSWGFLSEGSMCPQSRTGHFLLSDAGLVPWGTPPSIPMSLTFWKFLGVLWKEW